MTDSSFQSQSVEQHGSGNHSNGSRTGPTVPGVGTTPPETVVPTKCRRCTAPSKSELCEPCSDHYVNLRDIATKARATTWYRSLKPIGPCALCKTEPATTRDHIIPLALGGPHEPSNIQYLCKPCNSSKGSKLMELKFPTKCACGQRLYAPRSIDSGICSRCWA